MKGRYIEDQHIKPPLLNSGWELFVLWGITATFLLGLTDLHCLNLAARSGSCRTAEEAKTGGTTPIREAVGGLACLGEVGVEHVGLRFNIHYETGNWSVLVGYCLTIPSIMP